MTNINNNTDGFTIALKKGSVGGFDTISMLILALSYFSFLYKAFKQYNLVGIIVFAVLGAASGIWYYNIRRGVWPAKYGYLIFIVAAVLWFYQTGIGFAIGLVVMAAGILQVRLEQAPVVTVNDEGVGIRNIFASRYNWAQLNNVVIKDGLLTIDCKNNRLIQKEASEDITTQYEANFNEFCRLCLVHSEHIVHGR